MNRKQKAAIGWGIALILAMAVFPPWVHQFNVGALRERGNGYVAWSGGYAFCLLPPLPEVSAPGEFRGMEQIREFTTTRIDASRLILQWVAVGIFFGGLALILGDRRNKNGQTEDDR